jgi:hypothetical protein
VSVRNVVAGAGRYDLALERRPGRLTLTAERRSGSGEISFGFAPALALDARVRSAEVDGRAVRPKLTRLGDVQRVEVSGRGPRSRVVLEYDEGTEVIAPVTAPLPGARSEGLRVLRVRPENGSLRLVLEGRGGRSYTLRVRSARRLGGVAGVAVRALGQDEWAVATAFEGPADGYRRRELALPLGPR